MSQISLKNSRFVPRNWRYAKNGAADPDFVQQGIFYAKIRFSHSISYKKSHDIECSKESNRFSGDPNAARGLKFFLVAYH